MLKLMKMPCKMKRKAATSLCYFRGRTRDWIKRRTEKGHFYNIVTMAIPLVSMETGFKKLA